MKFRIICLLLPLFLLGCSKKSTEAERRANIQASPSLPFQITVVETPETGEINDISNNVVSLLAAQDYNKLDEVANQFRSSKEGYADGRWKLFYVFEGLIPSDNNSDTEWEIRLADLQSWAKAKPESITAQLALANDLVAYAWKARGSGYANTVTDEGAQLFGRRLNQAIEILAQAKNLKDQCPFYGTVLMRAGLGLGIAKSRFDAIFNQAVSFEPDYENYYYRRAIFLLPRWYGEEGEWEKDLAQSADRMSGEKGDILYARVVWNIHNYSHSGNIFNDNKIISWERVDRGFEAIEKRFPDSLAAKNERAHLAALAGDKEKARKYFSQTEGKVDLTDWSAKGEYLDAANWAYQ